MKKIIQVILMIFIFASCQINGTFQGLFSYYNKTKKESKINFIQANSFSECPLSIPDSATVLIANGNELKRCLEAYQNAIVYFWVPRCKGKYCYSLNMLQEICHQKGVELFIVAEYYDSFYMSKPYKISHPLIGINVKTYKTNLTSKYLPRFILDVTDGKYNASNNVSCNFLSFENGEFVKAFMTIEEI